MEGKQKVESCLFLHRKKKVFWGGVVCENLGYIVLYSLSVKQGVTSKEAATMI